jgi:hypothetical protein
VTPIEGLGDFDGVHSDQSLEIDSSMLIRILATAV